MSRLKFTLLLLAIFCAGTGIVYGEGTKQILLSDAGHGKLSIMPTFSEFAWYNNAGVSGNIDYRLNIRIKNLGEVIYYGLGDPLNNGGGIVNDVEYRIKDPSGAIVVGPTPVPLAGAGYISTFNEAIAGPSAIAGAPGYPELTYTPLMTGDYFIEFHFNTGGHDRTKFRYFDITVADAGNTAIDGRVWSKAWQCTADANGLNYDFYGTFYIYSQDSIVTSVYGNGMAPYVFTIACNQYGCFNTGNFNNDRRSVPGNHIIPQYLVFLNNPDSTIWPTGIIGQIVPPIVVTPDCNTGQATIDITVTKAGTVDLVMNINPLPGIQPQDRVMTTPVIYGVNTIPWDGLDGLGAPVPNGAIFDMNITYINGLTNLPIYDIDDNPNGFMINLHRPSGPLPKVYWDDNLIGGTQNFTGCTYTLPTTGCHDVLIAIGNNNTNNTWWNAATHVAAPITYVEHRTAIVGAAFGPPTVCANTSTLMYYCIPDPNASSYQWTYTGTDVTINGDGNNNDTVYLDFGPAATAGTLTVAGINAQCGAGPGQNFPVVINPIPDLTVSPLSHSQCSNIGTGIILTSTNPGTLFTWVCTASSGNVTGYSPNNVGATLINQTLVNTGSNVETVTYHLTPHLGPCTGLEADYVVTVFPVPRLTTLPLSKTQCNNMLTGINLTSNVSGATFTWTCIPSSLNITGYSSNFTPSTSINQTLVNIAYNIETVVYRILPSANGCTGPFTDYTVTIYPTPNLSNIPASKAQCNNTPTAVNLTSNVAGTLFTWTCIPSSGNVTGWANNGIPTTLLNQTLTNSGYNIETVTYQVIPRANGCNGPLTDFVVTVYPVPNLSNSPASKTVCSNAPAGITLTSDVSGTAFTWTCTPSSGFVTGWSNNVVPTTSLNQTLVNWGVTNQTVTYHITPIANGCTGPVTNYVVTVRPMTVITTNPLNKNICNNTSTNITLTANIPGTLYTWTCLPSSGNVTGWANSIVPAATIDQFLVNTGNVIENVTYTITPISNGCPGNPENYTVTVYPTPNLTNNPLSKAQCSNLPTNIILTSTVAGTLFTWTCTPSSANITGWANNALPASMLNQTLINSGNSAETVTYHITPEVNGCPGPVAHYTVTVYPVPALTTTPLSGSMCTFNLTNIVLTSNVPGALFTWACTASSGNVTGYSNSVSPGVFINQTLSNTGYTNEMVTYHIMPSANGCSGVETDFVMTVHPMPDLSNMPPSQSQCSNTNTNILLTSNVAGTLFTWSCFPTSGTLSGFANGIIPTNTINQVLINTGISTESVTYQLTPEANGCLGPVSDYMVTVFPVPHITTVPASKQQCNNINTNMIPATDVAGCMYTWTCTPSSASITGFSWNGIPAPSINQVLVNTGYNIETVVYHITPWANGCPGPVSDYAVTVFPTPDLSNTPLSQGQCNNTFTNLTLTSHVTGTLFTWSCTPSSGNITGWSNNLIPSNALNHQLISSSTTPETVIYHILPSANGCNGPVTDYVVTVFPTPALTNAPLSKNQCNNINTAVTLLSNVGGALFTWTCTPSSAGITGWANNPVPAGAIMQTLNNSGYNIEFVTYHITPVANGCPGNVTDFVVSVYPTPDVSNTPLSQAQCNNTSTNLPLTSNIAGATFTWICTPSGPGITGWANNAVPALTINQVLVNSTLTNQTVTYRITPAANGCTGPLTNYLVTVYPTPLLTTSPLNNQQCNNQATTITLISNVSGASFSWTCSPSSGNVTGFSPGNGTLINHTLVNTGYNTETVTYAITPLINGCPGPVSNYVVTVFPGPDLSNLPLSQSQCNNSTTNLALTSNVAGTLFTWTCTPSSGNITGWSNNPVPGTVLNQTLVNSGVNTEWVTYQVTPTANGCNGPVVNYVVTVFPTPNLTNNPLNQSQCNNLLTNITLTSGVAGAGFTWTCTPSSPLITGWSNNAVPATSLNQQLVSSSNIAETVVYAITPTANGCNGLSSNYTVTVFPTPFLTTNPLTKQQCNNQATNIALTSNVSGSFFSWTCTPSSANVTGFSPGNGPLIDQTLVNTGNMTETVTYHISTAANGCPGPAEDYTVTVFPTPVLTMSPSSQSQCSNLNTNITLTSNVTGTLFTWTCLPSSANITGFANSIVPGTQISQVLVNSGSNTETVTYQVTAIANGCANGTAANYVVTVFPTPLLTNSPSSQAQCNSLNTNVTLTSNVPGTLFTWICIPSSGNITGFANSTVPGTQISQTLINTGFITESVNYQVTAIANGCTSPAVSNFVVTVYPKPDLSNTLLTQTQCNNVNTNISLTSNVAGTLFTWICTASSPNVTGYSNSMAPGTLINQTLVNTGNNIETVTYHVTPHANGCNGSLYNIIVTLNPQPTLSNNPGSQTQCNNVNTNIALTSNVPGTLFTWTCIASAPTVTGFANNTIPSNTIQQVLLNSGLTVETVTYNLVPQANGCSGTTTAYVVTVNPVVLAFATPPAPVLCGGTTTSIANSSNIPGAAFSWTAAGSSQYVTGFGPGTGNMIIQNILNTGFNTETVTYTVIASANGCPGLPANVTATVLPQPFTTFTICNDPVSTTNSRPVTLRGGVPLGGTFTGPGVAGNIFTPAAAGPGNHVITYTVTNAMGCSKSATQTLVVLAATPFACGGILTDVRDNAQYPTVQIGTQCWMADNLNYGTVLNSTLAQRDNCVIEKYCFNNVTANCATQGGFYQWDELMHYAATNGDQGICPPGWHIPAETEWAVLFNSFGPRTNAIAASNLKSTGPSGYDATMTGFSGFNRSWNHGTFATIFWSSTSYGRFKAWAHGMNTPDDGVSTYPGFRANAFSLRCVLD